MELAPADALLVSAYHGNSAEANQRFQIAGSVAPDDPLNFFCTIRIAAAHFEAARYDEAARWFTRGLAEHPSAMGKPLWRAGLRAGGSKG
jgi:hypothetical protein